MCDGPRISRICILLKYRVLQKIDVRGPHFSEGTTNKVVLHSAVSQRIMKSRCSRSVVRRCDPGWCSGSFTPPFTPPAATLRMTRATTFRMTDNGFVQDECSVPDPSLPLRMTRAALFRMTDNGFVQDECSVPDPSLPLRMTRAATFRMTRAATFGMTRAAASVVT